MNLLFKSYLDYARGECKFSPWVILRPLGVLGKFVIKLRRAFYDHGIYSSEDAVLPVISVGNLTTGGTNKTPFVDYLVRRLDRMELSPGIVSRGYGGNTQAPVLIRGGHGDRAVVGDEPLLLSARLENVPVAVCSNRLADVKLLRSSGVKLVVADDAFQHRRMSRDVDIVLVDATCPFGNGTTLPSGILRELPDSLRRAQIVVITKSDQTTAEKISRLEHVLQKWVPAERIFKSHLGPSVWTRFEKGHFRPVDGEIAGKKLFLFSAIGNPASFQNTVSSDGMTLAGVAHFKDHHRYTIEELKNVTRLAENVQADALCCTEKDIFNLPSGFESSLPLYVPRIYAEVADEERFWKLLAKEMRPRLLVASNGFGEDAIAAELATRVKNRFPEAEVSAFPLVGKGKPYVRADIDISAPLTESPTGGIVKYHLRDLIREIRSGLFSHIARQFGAWKKVGRRCRTVLCVGDVYLLCHTLWGQGKRTLMMATAKTKYISGHWKLESLLYRCGCHRVWTRDEATAVELREAGVDAVFEGNPIMDLACDNNKENPLWDKGRRILVLPGSRRRTYSDVSLLLDTLLILARKIHISPVMVIAASIDIQRLAEHARGWTLEGEYLRCGNVSIRLSQEEVAIAARGAELLLGLAGTANQVCAGMGIPVLSVLEKGKLIQKKLIGDAELLVDPEADELAASAYALLNNPAKLKEMSETGRSRLGRSGASDSVIQYAADTLGWDIRCDISRRLKKAVDQNSFDLSRR